MISVSQLGQVYFWEQLLLLESGVLWYYKVVIIYQSAAHFSSKCKFVVNFEIKFIIIYY